MSEAPVTRPHVSVIVPAFNAGVTLRETVASVLAQTRGDLECLIIDDGSSDNTREIAKQLADEDDRVRLLEHADRANHGCASARNLGLKQARGEFIAFLDSDDTWLPPKLERQLQVMDRRPDVGFVFSDVQICIDPDPTRPMTSQPLERDQFRESMGAQFSADDNAAKRLMNLHLELYRFIPSPTPLVRRSLFESGLEFVGPPRLNIQYEDLLMWRVLSMRTKFVCIQEPLAIYRVHGSSFTGQFLQTRRSVVDHLIGLEEVERLYIETCRDVVDDKWLEELRESQRARIVGGAHQVPWLQLPRMFKLASKCGVSTEVLYRHMRAAIFRMRVRLSPLRAMFRLNRKSSS